MKKELLHLISLAISEDIGEGDYTSLACIPRKRIETAFITTKQNCIIAGIELAKMIFKKVDSKLKISYFKKDGDKVKTGSDIIKITGSSHSILKSERLVLNYMQRMSGIATQTYHMCKLIKDTKAKLLDTRKTTPLNRLVEKWAVKIGGGINHRFGLFDMIMIKDNHIKCSGSIEKAIANTNKYLNSKKSYNGTPL